MRTSADGFADTWYGGADQRDFESANLVYLTGGQLNLGLRPPGTGVLRGQLTDRGQPVSGATVQFIDLDAGFWGQTTTTTDGAGGYAFPNLWPGHYELQFAHNHVSQFYHQKETRTGAERITVLAGPDTVIDEQLIPPGTIELTVADEVTGAPVSEFCVFLPGTGGDAPCTTTGLIRATVTRGTYFLAIVPAPSYFPSM